MQILRPAAPLRRQATRSRVPSFRMVIAGVGVLAIASAVSLLGGGVAGAQSPQPEPSGPITFEPAVGDQQTIFIGLTAGGCSVAGADSNNSVVAGPGLFAPGATEGNPDGRTWSGTETFNFSTTEPIDFRNRLQLVDLAQEAGGPILPGEYVVTFRCVEALTGTIFQTYRTSITVADAGGGNFTLTANNPTGGPTPVPSGGTPTPVASGGTPTPVPSGGSPTPTPTGGSPTPTPAGGSPTPTSGTSPTPTASPGSLSGSTGSGTGGSGSSGSGGSGTSTGSGSGSGSTLAYTGAPLDSLVLAGVVLTATGVGLVVIGRRRRTQGKT